MTDLPPEPECLSRDDITRLQSRRLETLLRAVMHSNAFWRTKFTAAGVDEQSLREVTLHDLPVTTKHELVRDRDQSPPYGSNLTYELSQYSRMHQTSGTTGKPMPWLDTVESWHWVRHCWGQIYRIVGVRPADRFYFPFSFGPFLGFWSAFDGASALGNLCIPGGGLSSEARLQAIQDYSATIICATPTYALRLAEIAHKQGEDLANGTVRALIVAGEPGGSVPAIRQRIESLWGARVFDHWGMTELGPLGIECVENPAGLHLLETECIPEIVDPGSLEPVEPGQAGELLITNLGRLGAPLIRYRTGDLVRTDLAACPCGRELLRLEDGILGRADDMITVRGNNVFPSSIEAIIREFSQVVEFRINVSERHSMTHVRLEVEPISDSVNRARLQDEVRQAIKNRLQFQAEIDIVAPGTLPRFELKARRLFRESSS